MMLLAFRSLFAEFQSHCHPTLLCELHMPHQLIASMRVFVLFAVWCVGVGEECMSKYSNVALSVSVSEPNILKGQNVALRSTLCSAT